MIKEIQENKNRLVGTILILSCVFSNLLPFLTVDIRVMKLTVLRLVLLAVSLYCLGLWSVRVFRNKNVPGWRGHQPEWLVLGYLLLWSICGLIWLLFFRCPESASTEVIGIISIFLYAVCFFTLIRGKEDVLFYGKLLIACGVILALMADLEIVVGSLVSGVKGDYSLEERIQMKQTLFPPSAVFHNPNDLATFLLMCLGILAWFTLRTDKKRTLLGYAAVALVLLSPMPIINSTLFTLAFLFLCAVTAGLLVASGEKKKLGGWCKAAAIFLLVALYLFPFSAFVKYAGNKLNQAYFRYVITQTYSQEDVASFLAEDFEDNDSLFTQLEAAQTGAGTVHTRYWLIRAGLDYAGQNPVFGCGPGGFRVLMKAEENALYLTKAKGMVDPHNFYIELLAQYGSIVFFAYLGVAGYLIAAAWKKTVKEIRQKTVGTGTLSLILLVMFSICAIIPSSILRLMPLWLFFLLGVCAISCEEPARENG